MGTWINGICFNIALELIDKIPDISSDRQHARSTEVAQPKMTIKDEPA